MNRTFLSVVFTLSFAGISAFAQQSAPVQASPSDSAQPSRNNHHQPNPHRQAAILSHRLNLTPDQTARLEPILADRDQKLFTLHSDESLAPEAKRTQAHAIRLDTQQQLSNLLTPEQMQKMQSMHHHRGGHEQAPVNPSGL